MVGGCGVLHEMAALSGHFLVDNASMLTNNEYLTLLKTAFENIAAVQCSLREEYALKPTSSSYLPAEQLVDAIDSITAAQSLLEARERTK